MKHLGRCRELQLSTESVLSSSSQHSAHVNTGNDRAAGLEKEIKGVELESDQLMDRIINAQVVPVIYAYERRIAEFVRVFLQCRKHRQDSGIFQSSPLDCQHHRSEIKIKDLAPRPSQQRPLS